MPQVQATTRVVKNLNTRIDVTVPKVEKVANPRDVKHYYVLVVTKLVNVKSGEFTGDDVVQFIVPTTFEDFEKLHVQIVEQFPQYRQKLPPLPRKTVLFMSEETVKDRQVAFDKLVQFISKTEKLARSVPFYDFLGIDPLGDKEYVKKRERWLEEQKTKKKKEDKFSGDDLFTGEKTDDLFDDEDLFGDMSNIPSTEKAYQLASITDDPSHGQDVDQREMSPEVAELLDIQASMDDVLKIAAPKKEKGLVGSKAVNTSGREDQQGKSIDVTGMDKGDIMSYISSNMAANEDDDIDLF